MDKIKENKGRKVEVVGDDLGIKGAGFYAFMPFERVDIHKKAVFKIGMATAPIKKRIDSHHTDYPNGMYLVAFLEAPPVPRKTRTSPGATKKSHYLAVEKFIFKYIDDNEGKPIYSTTRVKDGGKTEWRYTNADTIHDAFYAAEQKFGGKAHYYHLDDINKDAAKIEKKHPFYTGKIYFV